MAGCCEDANEPSSSIKAVNVLMCGLQEMPCIMSYAIREAEDSLPIRTDPAVSGPNITPGAVFSLFSELVNGVSVQQPHSVPPISGFQTAGGGGA